MPLDVIFIVVHASYILLTSLNKLYLVLNRFFQLLIVEVVFHELFDVVKRGIFFDILSRIHILGEVGCKSIPEEWEIAVFVIVEDIFKTPVVVELVFIIHDLFVVWIVHGVGGRGGGFICQPILLGSTFNPTNGRGALLLFDCQIVDRPIDVSGVGESNGR